MAKRNTDGTFISGVIYCLVSNINTDKADIFYVGESIHADMRSKQHLYAGKNADGESTDVYKHIQELEINKVPWCYEVIYEYGKEGPKDLEDKALIELTLAGCVLKNEKRGNQHWLDVLADMQKHGFKRFEEWQEYQRSVEAKKALKTPQQVAMAALLASVPKSDKKSEKASKDKRILLKKAGKWTKR